MLYNIDNVLLIGSVLLFVSVAVSKTSYRFGVPVLLLFLVVGMLFGSDGLGLQFNDIKKAQFVGTFALCIILFSGGMDTKYSEIKTVLKQGIILSSLGVLITACLTGFFVYCITGMGQTNPSFSFITCFLLAATMSSTDSASVFNTLRTQKIGLKHNLRPLLELESGSNDPVAYVLVVILTQLITSASMGTGDIILKFFLQFAVGASIGYAAGKLSVFIINKINMDNKSLYSILLLSIVFAIFSITDLLQGNGYLAVYIAGIIIGNNKMIYKKNIAIFFDGLTWLFQIIMFIVLGLLVNPRELLEIAVVALLIGLFLIIIARPLSIFLCLLPFKTVNLSSKIFISWVGLRGAVPIIFAMYPAVEGIEGSAQIFNIVFFITILSLVIQGTTIPFMAKQLKLAEPLKKKHSNFGVEMPEETNTLLSDITVSEEMLENGNLLMDLSVPAGRLIILVKRHDEFIIPNGTLHIHVGDKLLVMSDSRE